MMSAAVIVKTVLIAMRTEEAVDTTIDATVMVEIDTEVVEIDTEVVDTGVVGMVEIDMTAHPEEAIVT